MHEYFYNIFGSEILIQCNIFTQSNGFYLIFRSICSNVFSAIWYDSLRTSGDSRTGICIQSVHHTIQGSAVLVAVISFFEYFFSSFGEEPLSVGTSSFYMLNVYIEMTESAIRRSDSPLEPATLQPSEVSSKRGLLGPSFIL